MGGEVDHQQCGSIDGNWNSSNFGNTISVSSSCKILEIYDASFRKMASQSTTLGDTGNRWKPVYLWIFSRAVIRSNRGRVVSILRSRRTVIHSGNQSP